MNKELMQGILIYKSCAAAERALLAERQGNLFKAHKFYRLSLVASRIYAYSAIQSAQDAHEKYSTARRAAGKAREAGITSAFTKAALQRLEQAAETADDLVVSIGELIINTLDDWQRVGATLLDLCALCGIPYDLALKRVKPERRSERLSAILYITEIDDRYPERWSSGYPYDAPLSYAVQRFFTNFMTKTPEGRKAAHEALEQCFPEIMENALHLVTDADGVKHLIDKDGVEVGTVGEG